jgi:hypothetical protein
VEYLSSDAIIACDHHQMLCHNRLSQSHAYRKCLVWRIQFRITEVTLQDDMERFRTFTSFDSALDNRTLQQQAAGKNAESHRDFVETAKLGAIRLRMDALEVATAAPLSTNPTEPLQNTGKPTLAANRTTVRLLDLAEQGLQLNSSLTDSVPS